MSIWKLMMTIRSAKRVISLVFLLGAGLFLTGMAGRKERPNVYVKTVGKGHYQLIVDGKPYIIKGVCYNPIPIGKSYDYDFWNDPNEPWKQDGALMQKMGINTVRFYAPGADKEAVKRVVSDLWQLYGIRTIMGHWLNFWHYPAPYYDDEGFRKNVEKEVLETVEAFKDEEGILFWVLGNENNYSFSGRINPWSSERIDKMGDPRQCMLLRAEVYYTMINKLTRSIHRLDPNHPVAMGNGETFCLDVASRFAPDIDILGCVMYRGKSFGNVFNNVRQTFDKPLVFIEFGCDAYDMYKGVEDEDVQAKFIESQWRDIYKNLAGDGAGNCLGGTLFEWTDEWWKHNDWDANRWAVHDTESNWSNGAYYFDIKAERNMNMNEEWFGLVKLSPEEGGGLDKRTPRKAYYVIREFWKNPVLGNNNKKKKK